MMGDEIDGDEVVVRGKGGSKWCTGKGMLMVVVILWW